MGFAKRLFRSDGTSAGTSVVSSVPDGVGRLVAHAGEIYFSGYDPEHGNELWKSDGTAAGTVFLKDLVPGPASSFHAKAHSVGDFVYLIAPDALRRGTNIWRTDGTPEGTTIALHVPGHVPEAVAYRGAYYFTVAHPQETVNSPRPLFKIGPDVPVPVPVAPLVPRASKLKVVGDKLVFDGYGSVWTSDGTILGTGPLVSTELPTLDALTSLSTWEILDPLGPRGFGSAAMVAGRLVVEGHSDLWSVDGMLVHKIDGPWHNGQYTEILGVAGGRLITHRYAIDVTSGAYTDLGPLRVVGEGSTPFGNVINLNDVLLYTAYLPDERNGYSGDMELYRTDGTVAGTYLLKDINKNCR